MDVPITKSSLTRPQTQLVELLQTVNFGRIEGLLISGGQPDFRREPRIIWRLKVGGENETRPEAAMRDFRLKDQVVELFRLIAQLEGGHSISIEVRHGLPFTVEAERCQEPTGEHPRG